jgi:hypothetical protein
MALFTRMCLILYLFYTISKLIANRCECLYVCFTKTAYVQDLFFRLNVLHFLLLMFYFLTAGVSVDMEGMILLACILL